jgi:hypothetical protein
MSAYGCMECGFNSNSWALADRHDAQRPASCQAFGLKLRRIEALQTAVDATSPLRLTEEPFASLDQELEDYWQKIAPLYVREEA